MPELWACALRGSSLFFLPMRNSILGKLGTSLVPRACDSLVTVRAKSRFKSVKKQHHGDTDSESDMDDDTPRDITVTRFGRAIRAHFCLDF